MESFSKVKKGDVLEDGAIALCDAVRYPFTDCVRWVVTVDIGNPAYYLAYHEDEYPDGTRVRLGKPAGPLA